MEISPVRVCKSFTKVFGEKKSTSERLMGTSSQWKYKIVAKLGKFPDNTIQVHGKSSKYINEASDNIVG
jgi:hypothetical protein